MNDGRYDQAVIEADADSSGARIEFSVIGGDWQKHEAVQALRKLTVLPKYKGDVGTLPLTWAVVLQADRIARQYGFKWLPGARLREWNKAEVYKRFDEDGELKFDATELNRIPMPHQKAGAYLGANCKRVFYADQMGTGKSATALLTLAELEARRENPFPALIVAPASVVDPWLEEIEEWGFTWAVTAYRGTRRRQLSTRYQVYVTSWDTFRTDMQAPVYGVCPCGPDQRIEWTRTCKNALKRSVEMRNPALAICCPACGTPYSPEDAEKTELPSLLQFIVPRSIVLDEAHALCNVKTAQSIAARKIARVADYAFLMSGTPITHDVGGFWSALNVLDIHSFPSQERYKEQYADTHSEDYGQRKVDGLTTVNREEFYTLMQGTMRRTAKADVLTDLPPKRYSVRVVEIPAKYRAAYDEMEADMIAHIPDTDEPLPVMSTLAQLQRLSQLASSACDVEVTTVVDDKEGSLTYGEEIPHYKVTMREPSWKVDELMELLAESEGSPLVTFAPHTQLIELAGKRAEALGYRVGYIKGGQSHGQRTKTRQAFQAGELDLLCANTAAGGTGLTLTRASTLVFLERPWSYVQSAQAEDRIHRRGQTEEAHIIDIVAKNTVESRVRLALRDKAAQLSDLVRDPRIVKELLGGHPLRV